MLAGLQVPVIPSFDVGGRTGTVAFWQYESAIVGKVGKMLRTIVIFIETGTEQVPTVVGVNL